MRDEVAELDEGGDVGGLPSDYAYRQLTVVLTPRIMQLRRLVIGEVSRFPDLARVLYERGPQRAMDALAAASCVWRSAVCWRSTIHGRGVAFQLADHVGAVEPGHAARRRGDSQPGRAPPPSRGRRARIPRGIRQAMTMPRRTHYNSDLGRGAPRPPAQARPSFLAHRLTAVRQKGLRLFIAASRQEPTTHRPRMGKGAMTCAPQGRSTRLRPGSPVRETGDCEAIAAPTLVSLGKKPLIQRHVGPVAQWLEPAAHNRLVGGSSPSGPHHQAYSGPATNALSGRRLTGRDGRAREKRIP